MAEHLSLTEIDKESKKIKRDLEAWREVILLVNSLLVWEKNYYIGVILATTSVTFFLLWHLDPSILTLLSFLGIVITVADYSVPKLSLHFCNQENWTSAKERKLESICKSLAGYKIFLSNLIKSFYRKREEHPKFYYVTFISTLLVLFWIGNAVNNLFLTYLVVTSLLLLPGIQQRGIFDKHTTLIYNMIKDNVKPSENKKLE